MLTVAELTKLMAETRRDPRPWLEAAYNITTKGLPGQQPVQKLLLNRPQERIHEAIQQARAEGRPPRIIVLKARQPGISSLCGGLVTAAAWSNPHSVSIILTHLDESSEKLLGKCVFAVDHLPPEIKPVEKRRRTSMIHFDYLAGSDGAIPLNSQIQVATASGRELWRGMTIHNAHCSELAQFPYAQETLAGLMQAVPKSPNSLVVLESTARGEGDAFHREWVRAENGESDFVPIFIPWWELPDAILPVPRSFMMNKEERAIKRKYMLTTEQVVWYRYVLHTEVQGNLDMFNQEYPDTPENAFLTSGQPAFPPKPLREMAEKARKVEPMRGDVVESESGPIFSKFREGPLAVYITPKEEHEYTIGADSAAGVEGGDYSCAVVLDRKTCEVVAVWHGHITPVEFAGKLAKLGVLYNEAWLAPETNCGHGFVIIDELKRCFYQRIYVYTRVDKLRNVLTNFLGWETNTRTRGLLFDSMHYAISQHDIMIWDYEVIRELRGMRYVDARRAEGMGHDDRAIAAMIAYRVHWEMPLLETGVPPRVGVSHEKKVQPEEPELPDHNLSRQVWIETDQTLRSMVHSTRSTMDEYGEMPDLNEEKAWDPGAGSWTPEIPY